MERALAGRVFRDDLPPSRRQAADLPRLVALGKMPEVVRGYGHIKEANVARYRAECARHRERRSASRWRRRPSRSMHRPACGVFHSRGLLRGNVLSVARLELSGPRPTLMASVSPFDRFQEASDGPEKRHGEQRFAQGCVMSGGGAVLADEYRAGQLLGLDLSHGRCSRPSGSAPRRNSRRVRVEARSPTAGR